MSNIKNQGTAKAFLRAAVSYFGMPESTGASVEFSANGDMRVRFRIDLSLDDVAAIAKRAQERTERAQAASTQAGQGEVPTEPPKAATGPELTPKDIVMRAYAPSRIATASGFVDAGAPCSCPTCRLVRATVPDPDFDA